MASIAAVAKMGRLALDQWKFVIESMLMVSFFKKCLINLKKYFGTSIRRGAFRKFMKKWNEASVFEDQIRGWLGRPKDAQTNENITLLRRVRVDISKLRLGVNFKLKYHDCVDWS